MQSKLYKVVVGNKLVNDFSHSMQVFSPINNEIVGSVPSISSKEQIESIFKKAKNSFFIYQNISLEIRKKMLLNFAELLKKNWNEISNLIVWEIAKTKNEAIEEVDRSIEYIKETIKEYENLMKQPIVYDEQIHGVKGKTGKFSYEPLGVVLAISPFNYPLNLLITKIIPALISGNVVVYKPATQGSCLGAYISTLLYEAGFRNGEVSCIIGKGSEIGDFLISNKDINMITFTGSTIVGRNIAEKNPLIPVVLELGGKDTAIVLKDANLKKTVKEIVKGAFNFNGQRCTAIKKVLVDSKIESEFIELINKEIDNLKVGSALDSSNKITEMIDLKSIKFNLQLLLDAYNNKARTDQKIKRKGNIFWPVALYNVTSKCRIAWEEQFGPVLPIMRFDTIEEAIDNCNKSEYGLQASIFTQNIVLAKKIATLLDVGTVNINKSSSRGPDIFPFIAIKNSGKGMQGIRESIISMNRLKGIIENE